MDLTGEEQVFISSMNAAKGQYSIHCLTRAEPEDEGRELWELTTEP